MPTVAVVGDAVLDVAIRATGPIVAGGDVPAVIRIGAGGQGANVAVRLARAGVGVRLVCGLADDDAGRLVRQRLDADAVVVGAVPVPATGTVAILLDGSGERSMLSQRASFVDAVDPRAATAPDWLVVSGYVLGEVGAAELARRLVRAAPRRAVLGCSLPASARARWLEAVAAIEPGLVIVNAEELDALAGNDVGRDPAAALANRLAALVVVTTVAGARACGVGVASEVAAGRSPRVVDVTGAGDAFAAGVIAGLRSADWPPSSMHLEDAMRAGLSLAREVVGVGGAQGRVESESAPAGVAG